MVTRIALIVGTRPEVIKMAPLWRALTAAPDLAPLLIATGQHRELLLDALKSLGLALDDGLGWAPPGQHHTALLAALRKGLPPLLSAHHPAAVLVQGDTTSALAAAQSAHALGVPLGHVEAGLRSHDPRHPWPEEDNRRAIDHLADWCFAPTETAARNLRREGISPDRIHLTGNTGIDALRHVLPPAAVPPEPLVLVTLHRRESLGAPLRAILQGVCRFLDDTPEARALMPLHPNPAVAEAVAEITSGQARFHAHPALAYPELIATLARCRLVLTDSGGVQEEAPSLGRPVLVARERTERPEGISSGQARLVGRSATGVRTGLAQAWCEAPYEGPWPAPSPYGDGHAAERICAVIRRSLLAEGLPFPTGEPPPLARVATDRR